MYFKWKVVVSLSQPSHKHDVAFEAPPSILELDLNDLTSSRQIVNMISCISPISSILEEVIVLFHEGRGKYGVDNVQYVKTTFSPSSSVLLLLLYLKDHTCTRSTTVLKLNKRTLELGQFV